MAGRHAGRKLCTGWSERLPPRVSGDAEWRCIRGGEGRGIYLKILEKALKTVAKIWCKNVKNEQYQKLLYKRFRLISSAVDLEGKV